MLSLQRDRYSSPVQAPVSRAIWVITLVGKWVPARHLDDKDTGMPKQYRKHQRPANQATTTTHHSETKKRGDGGARKRTK